MQHLRYAEASFEEQKAFLFDIVMQDALTRSVLEKARALAMPDWRLVSGAIYNTVWNHLTGRPTGHGIKDADLFYFDGSDLSWEAEDKWIRAGDAVFSDCLVPVEIKNQARVHLWFKDRFGLDYPVLSSPEEGIDRFASRTHAVGLRLRADDTLDLYAPYGLEDIFSFQITPNRLLDNRETHEEKGRRALRNWPELEVIDW